MKKSNIIKTAILTTGIVIGSISVCMSQMTKIASAYTSGDWWSNSCNLPSGYTEIGTILSNPELHAEYTTRGTITSIEENNFFIQSRGHAIYIYNTSLSNVFSVGNVVDVTGVLTSYYGMYELAPTAFTLHAESNPYPVQAETREVSTFNTDTNFEIGKYIEMSGLSADLETSFTTSNHITFNENIDGYLAAGDKKMMTNKIKEILADDPKATFKFSGIEGAYINKRQIRITSMDSLVVEGSGEEVKATSISITDSKNVVLQGKNFQFTADVLPKNTTNKAVTWSTTAGSTITNSGVFTSNTIGTYTVTAKTTDGSNLSVSANIEVISQSDIGQVIENPNQTGDVLGPMYIPGKYDVPTVSYLEMISQYGDSIIFDYGDFEMVIDGGNSGDGNNVRNAIKEHCEDGQIEILMLSHPHGDHIGAFNKRNSFESATGVSKIKYIINSEPIETESATACYSLFNSYIDEGTILYDSYSMVNNTKSNFPNVFQITNDISLRILDTDAYVDSGGVRPENTNDMSIASLLSIGNSRYFLCGDLTGEPERNVVYKYGSLGYWSASTYNIVKANHHCSNTHSSNSSTWINSIKPDVVVASCAIESKNRTESGPLYTQHPTAGSVARYLDATENFYCNMINGTITFTHNDELNDPTMSFAGRTIDYYTNEGILVSREAEKTIKFQESEFYKALYLTE